MWGCFSLGLAILGIFHRHHRRGICGVNERLFSICVTSDSHIGRVYPLVYATHMILTKTHATTKLMCVQMCAAKSNQTDKSNATYIQGASKTGAIVGSTHLLTPALCTSTCTQNRRLATLLSTCSVHFSQMLLLPMLLLSSLVATGRASTIEAEFSIIRQSYFDYRQQAKTLPHRMWIASANVSTWFVSYHLISWIGWSMRAWQTAPTTTSTGGNNKCTKTKTRAQEKNCSTWNTLPS